MPDHDAALKHTQGWALALELLEGAAHALSLPIRDRTHHAEHSAEPHYSYGFGRVFRPVIGETRDLRVQWALEETGLPYRVHALDHTGGEFDGPDFGRINCFRLAPVIDDDGFTVAESGRSCSISPRNRAS
jgi:hypothetical protein